MGQETTQFGCPSRIGTYPIDQELGRGGMGVVYLARDTRLGRRVAIKILPVQVANDPDRRARFEREARTAALLNHPNIATIFELGEADGTYYIAMEYVDGCTLAEHIAELTVAPLIHVLELAEQIAEGLSHRMNGLA